MPEDRNKVVSERERRPQGAFSLPAAEIAPDTRRLRFSLRYLDLGHSKFSPQKCGADFYEAVLRQIQIYSEWEVEDFRDANNKESRHAIDFSQTTEQLGFTNLEPEQLSLHEAWQFGINKRTQWRVHGILIDDTFFVVWLDPEHALYG